MDEIARRSFVKSAAAGTLAFTINGVEVWLTAAQARAEGVPLRTLTPVEAETLGALGETLAIGAREAGIAHFVDQQVSIPSDDALLSLRVTETPPPYANFYRAALAGVDRSSRGMHQNGFAQLTADQQRNFVDRLRLGKLENWEGPPQTAVYLTIRNDAIDVAYGTMDGFAKLDIPYMPHIAPERKW
jgi:hypothetical protein